MQNASKPTSAPTTIRTMETMRTMLEASSEAARLTDAAASCFGSSFFFFFPSTCFFISIAAAVNAAPPMAAVAMAAPVVTVTGAGFISASLAETNLSLMGDPVLFFSGITTPLTQRYADGAVAIAVTPTPAALTRDPAKLSTSLTASAVSLSFFTPRSTQSRPWPMIVFSFCSFSFLTFSSFSFFTIRSAILCPVSRLGGSATACATTSASSANTARRAIPAGASVSQLQQPVRLARTEAVALALRCWDTRADWTNYSAIAVSSDCSCTAAALQLFTEVPAQHKQHCPSEQDVSCTHQARGLTQATDSLRDRLTIWAWSLLTHKEAAR